MVGKIKQLLLPKREKGERGPRHA